MGNIQQRAGRVRIRLGGNTQEFAGWVDHIPDRKAIEKDLEIDTKNPVRPGLNLFLKSGSALTRVP